MKKYLNYTLTALALVALMACSEDASSPSSGLAPDGGKELIAFAVSSAVFYVGNFRVNTAGDEAGLIAPGPDPAGEHTVRAGNGRNGSREADVFLSITWNSPSLDHRSETAQAKTCV